MQKYDADIVAWANEQAALLRSGRFDLLDLEHIAEEIEDVGKSEQRELMSRMALLLAHLLKWHYQPERRGKSWLFTIREQRRAIALHMNDVPSLKTKLEDEQWIEKIWIDARIKVAEETGLDLTDSVQWPLENVLDSDWMPD